MNARPSDKLAIAVAQLNSTVGDIAGNVEKVRRARETAASQGADLVVFPELFIAGYPPEDLVLKPAFQAACRSAIEALARETASGGPALTTICCVPISPCRRPKTVTAGAISWRHCSPIRSTTRSALESAAVIGTCRAKAVRISKFSAAAPSRSISRLIFMVPFYRAAIISDRSERPPLRLGSLAAMPDCRTAGQALDHCHERPPFR